MEQRGEGLEECHPWALGLVRTRPPVIPGPSSWAPAGSKERALPFCRASLLRSCAAGPALPGTSVVAMATTEVLTC